MKPTVLADIEHRILIEASVDRVWDVLTDPAHVVAWLGCLQYRPEVGHLFYMQPDAAKRAGETPTGPPTARFSRLRGRRGWSSVGSCRERRGPP